MTIVVAIDVRCEQWDELRDTWGEDCWEINEFERTFYNCVDIGAIGTKEEKLILMMKLLFHWFY